MNSIFFSEIVQLAGGTWDGKVDSWLCSPIPSSQLERKGNHAVWLGGIKQRLCKGEVFPAGSGWEYKPLLQLILLLQKDTTQAGHKVSAKRKYQHV